MKVIISSYNPRWADWFQQIKRDLETCLQDTPYVAIEHVGSTSVPGLAAKPIIDIDIVVQPAQLTGVRDALVQRGGYEARGEMGIPGREVFRLKASAPDAGAEWDGKGDPKRNLYVCLEGGQAVRNHLAVRDVCRREEGLREEYARRKMELSGREWRDVNEYTEGKNEVLFWILERAGFGEGELEDIRRLNAC